MSFLFHQSRFSQGVSEKLLWNTAHIFLVSSQNTLMDSHHTENTIRGPHQGPQTVSGAWLCLQIPIPHILADLWSASATCPQACTPAEPLVCNSLSFFHPFFWSLLKYHSSERGDSSKLSLQCFCYSSICFIFFLASITT